MAESNHLATVAPTARQTSQIACSRCSLGRLCLPAGLSKNDMHQLEQIVHKSKPIQPGEHVFRSGDPFNTVVAVRSGCFKSYRIDEEGNEQILGFHLPGELIGLDGIDSGEHLTSVVALATSGICGLSFDQLSSLAREIPDLQNQLFRFMSRRISELANSAADRSAEQKMAAFLLDLSDRFYSRGYSKSEFNLAMSRADIAKYLRLAPETVSRVLARFQQQGMITVNRKYVHLQDLDALKTLGNHHCARTH